MSRWTKFHFHEKVVPSAKYHKLEGKTKEVFRSHTESQRKVLDGSLFCFHSSSVNVSLAMRPQRASHHESNNITLLAEVTLDGGFKEDAGRTDVAGSSSDDSKVRAMLLARLTLTS